eukprot:445060-Pyramimonas_sp.AAC.1
MPFKDQVAALMCLLAGGAHAAMRRSLSNVNHKVCEGMGSQLQQQRAKFVVKREKSITFGTGRAWRDAEADEA